MEIVIRHAEPDDYEAIHRIFSSPRVIEETLHLPLPPAEMWRKRLSERPESFYALVTCADGEVVGDLGLETYPTLTQVELTVYTDNEIGMSFRVSEISSGTAWSSKSSQSTPLTSGVPSSPKTTRSLSIL
jgi:hypothetical protein